MKAAIFDTQKFVQIVAISVHYNIIVIGPLFDHRGKYRFVFTTLGYPLLYVV